jgi:capsular polysaccharide biosynthesis protein
LFNNATHIVGLHGAGFANLAFSKPKTLVLELKSKFAGPVCGNAPSIDV